MKKIIFTSILAYGLAIAAAAQTVKTPAPSPLISVNQEFSTSFVEYSYSRPSVKSRTVFGDLVPYGQPWRTGANAPTKLTFGEDVIIGGKEIKAGSYVLYTIPNQDQWEVILNSGNSRWTAQGFDKKDDVVRFKVKPTATNDIYETFTINMTDFTTNSCNITLAWEKTKLIIPVKAENNDRIVKSLEEAINKPQIPYLQAANYYYETNQKLDLAAQYADKAFEANPQAFWIMWLKARILQKTGNYQGALDAANKSADLAKGTPYAEEYRRNSERLAKEINKK